MGRESEDCDYVWERFPKVATELTPEGEAGIQLMIKSYKCTANQRKSKPKGWVQWKAWEVQGAAISLV